MPADLHGVDLNLLVALDALLRQKSVTRAGEQLGITQSAMSNTLGRLRRLLDDDIFVRVGREWRLTPRAAALRDPLERMLSVARDEILWPTEFDPATSERHFRIATANSSAVILLAPLVSRLADVAPRVVVQIVPVGRPRNELLDQPDIDLLLLPDYYGLTHPNRPVLSLEWTCVVDRNHPVRGDRFDRESFVAYPHVVYEHDGMATRAHSTLVAHNLEGRGRVVVDDFVLIPFLLRGSRFVGLLQDALAETLLEWMPLRRLDPPMPLPGVQINMYWNGRNDRDPVHRWLRDELLGVSGRIRRH